MAKEFVHSPDSDLDKTDRMPILEGVHFDHDVLDDAVPMDHTQTAVMPGLPGLAAGGTPDFVRTAGVDLPSLAESVRSAEARIARQNADYEALGRAYERSLDAESVLAARADALTSDLAAARTALESEQARTRELDKLLAERGGSIESARSQVEAALRESERYQAEARTLRESLAARDATIAGVLHSLGERDAQLAALQAEHAKMMPALEATSVSTTQLDAQLQAALALQLKRGEAEVNAARNEVAAVKAQADSYLEVLRTREWRRGFDQNILRELDAQVSAANAGHGALASERDRLQSLVAELEAKMAAQLSAADSAAAKLNRQLAIRDKALADALEHGDVDGKRAAELLDAAERRHAQHSTQLVQLRDEHSTQLAELRDQLAAKSSALLQLDEESQKLRAALERTRVALEEREFLIRRLERSESNSANALGRIQTSIERLGSVPHPSANVAPAAEAEWSAELIRIDGDRPVTHVLSRRTRIGRAAVCELQIESSTVSRHHALILVGPRDSIIEDLNSTNGVLVNGRKVTRQVLGDGDAVTIGEVQFRYVARQLYRPPGPAIAGPAS